MHQDSRIPFAVESSLPPFVLEKELVDYPLCFVNESVNEMKKKGKLKELLPKRTWIRSTPSWMLCNLSLLSSHASFILCERADGMFYYMALFNLILTPIIKLASKFSKWTNFNGLLHFKGPMEFFTGKL